MKILVFYTDNRYNLNNGCSFCALVGADALPRFLTCESESDLEQASEALSHTDQKNRTRQTDAACATTLIALVLLAASFSTVKAQTVSLGVAQNFAVLGGTTVTNTGATSITGSVGVSPGTAIAGFPPGTVTQGTLHAGDGLAG